MINGIVNHRRELIFRRMVIGPSGSEEVEFVLDTGFNGSLTLPLQLIQRLGLQWRDRREAMMADGRTELFDIFEVTVDWDGRPTQIVAYASGPDALIGTSLLYGFELTAQIIDGGPATLKRL